MVGRGGRSARVDDGGGGHEHGLPAQEHPLARGAVPRHPRVGGERADRLLFAGRHVGKVANQFPLEVHPVNVHVALRSIFESSFDRAVAVDGFHDLRSCHRSQWVGPFGSEVCPTARANSVVPSWPLISDACSLLFSHTRLCALSAWLTQRRFHWSWYRRGAFNLQGVCREATCHSLLCAAVCFPALHWVTVELLYPAPKKIHVIFFARPQSMCWDSLPLAQSVIGPVAQALTQAWEWRPLPTVWGGGGGTKDEINVPIALSAFRDKIWGGRPIFNHFIVVRNIII